MSDSFNPFSNPDTYTNEQSKKLKYQESNFRPTVQTNIIEDYEPFNNQPAILPTEHNTVSQPKATVQDLEKLQRDLEERSLRLAEQEERLNQPEYAASNKNFPPICRCCPLKPCFYQAIDVEIPEEYRAIVRLGFIIWIAYSMTLFVNIFGALCYMIIRKVSNDTGAMFGLSILYFLLFVPLSYMLWFRPLYKAFKNNSSFNFFFFFIVFGCQIIILIIQMLGINVLGSCGWIISSQIYSENVGIMIFMMIIATAFTLNLAGCIFIIIRVNMYFRVSGGSMQKAKEELSKDAVSNPTVRSTASEILRNQ